MHDPSAVLLERAAQLERLEAVLATAYEGDGGRLVVLPGAAGLGKTSLLEAAVAAAEAAGARALVARASDLEGEFAFGVVRQLFEGAVLAAGAEARADLLSGAARHAAAVLDLDPEAGPDRDVHTSLHGLYWLLVNLSGEQPLLVAIDDVQWADEPSVRWLAYAARRLERLPIVVVAAVRTEPEGGLPALPEDASTERRAALEELVSGAHGVRVAPEPLSADAVGALITASLGTDPDPAFADACRRQTGGNAFLVSELVAELAAEEVTPAAGSVGRVADVVPGRVGETIRRHLARVSPDARELAAWVAVAGDGADVELVAELAGIEPAAARRAAVELVTAQVFADAPEPRFRHPLLRAAVHAQTPALERADRHARAAELLEGREAASGRIAAHLLLSPAGGGREWAVVRLRAAAASARSQGAAQQAIALLRRALSEPPSSSLHGPLLRELGEAELAALDPEATEHLRLALELSDDPAARLDIAEWLTLSLYHGGHNAEAIEVAVAAGEEARRQPGMRERRLAFEALIGPIGRYSLTTQARTRGRLEELAATLAGDTPAERQVLAAAASVAPASTAAELYDATRRGVASSLELPTPDPTEGIGFAAMFLHAGRPDAARELIPVLEGRAGASGSPMAHSIMLLVRGSIALDAGDLPGARADLDAAYDIWRDSADSLIDRTTAPLMIELLVAAGEVDAAEGFLERYDLAGDVPDLMFYNPLFARRGALRLAQRRYAEAEADFLELGRRHEVWGIDRPVPAWRSGAARARLALGRTGEARELAELELEAARRWGTPKSIAIAMHVRALTADGEDAIAELGQALALLEDTPWRLDRARIRLDLGAALRRAGRRRDARAALTGAMDEANACGAEPLAEAAADELRASGARPRRRAVSGIDALTPSEMRVTELAAEGRTNREIAQELFVTMGTVETHLSRVYRKLDVPGRAALAEALAAATSRARPAARASGSAPSP